MNWDTLFRNKVELRGSLTVDGKGSFTGGMDVRAARSNTPALRISSAGSEHSISYADSFIVGVGTGNIGGGAFGIYKTSGNGAGNVMTIDGNGQFQFNRHVTMKTLGSSPGADNKPEQYRSGNAVRAYGDHGLKPLCFFYMDQLRRRRMAELFCRPYIARRRQAGLEKRKWTEESTNGII